MGELCPVCLVPYSQHVKGNGSCTIFRVVPRPDFEGWADNPPLEDNPYRRMMAVREKDDAFYKKFILGEWAQTVQALSDERVERLANDFHAAEYATIEETMSLALEAALARRK